MSAEHLKQYRFAKGQSGNKNGRPKGTLNKVDVDAMFGRMASASVEELKQKLAEGSKATALEQAIASVYLKAIDSGDASRLETLMQRSIGKVKDVVEQHNHEHGKEIAQGVPTPELLKLVANEKK